MDMMDGHSLAAMIIFLSWPATKIMPLLTDTQGLAIETNQDGCAYI
jgi:hypothetical protein